MITPWASQFRLQDLKILEEKEVFSGYSHIKQFTFQYPLFSGGTSQPIPREVIFRPSAVTVLLIDPAEKKVVLVEQFRAGALSNAAGPWLLELVAGVCEEGERPEETAYREVKEETGCEILSLIPICSYFTTPGISVEKIFIYCGKVKAPQLNHQTFGIVEEGEDIKVCVLSVDEVFQLLAEGKIVSSPALIGLQWLQLNFRTLHFPQ